MTTILIRTLIIYFFLILTVRLMGKRQIGELEVTDLASTLLISEIASLPITNQDIPVLYAVIPMVALLFLEVGSSILLLLCPKLKNFLSASPAVLVKGGKLDQKALRDSRISLDELMGEVRQNGIPDLSMVSDAILEQNGKMTIFPKPQFAPPQAKDLNLSPQDKGLSHIVFENGEISLPGLSLIGKDRAWLEEKLNENRTSPASLFCVTANASGELFFILKEEKP